MDINPPLPCKKSVKTIHNHYARQTNPNIFKIDDIKEKTQLTQVIMVPTKWARKFLLDSCTPYNIIKHLAAMTHEWESDIIEKMEYIRDWEIGAYF